MLLRLGVVDSAEIRCVDPDNQIDKLTLLRRLDVLVRTGRQKS